MKKKITDFNLYQFALYIGTYFSLAFGIMFGCFAVLAKINKIDDSKPLTFFFISAILFVVFKPLLYKELNKGK